MSVTEVNRLVSDLKQIPERVSHQWFSDHYGWYEVKRQNLENKNFYSGEKNNETCISLAQTPF